MTDLRTDLIAVKELLATSETWTRGCFALDASGNETTSNDLRACKWCLLGAVEKICTVKYYRTAQFLDTLIAKWYPLRAPYNSPVVNVSDFNDAFGFVAVHELLDVAISQATQI